MLEKNTPSIFTDGQGAFAKFYDKIVPLKDGKNKTVKMVKIKAGEKIVARAVNASDHERFSLKCEKKL